MVFVLCSFWVSCHLVHLESQGSVWSVSGLLMVWWSCALCQVVNALLMNSTAPYEFWVLCLHKPLLCRSIKPPMKYSPVPLGCPCTSLSLSFSLYLYISTCTFSKDECNGDTVSDQRVLSWRYRFTPSKTRQMFYVLTFKKCQILCCWWGWAWRHCCTKMETAKFVSYWPFLGLPLPERHFCNFRTR